MEVLQGLQGVNITVVLGNTYTGQSRHSMLFASSHSKLAECSRTVTVFSSTPLQAAKCQSVVL